ncbi:MAG: DUF2911 domain-containing protein [Phycisphaerae bacterium]|nr:DUF2911 domain-containing protein [Gemmatimonadaceae bacterium]
MRRLLPAVAFLFAASTLHAQTGARRAAPSTRGVVEVALTFTDTAAQRVAGKPALIRLDYGQPHLRGRRINTDSLVPFGTVWRLGANGATLLNTDVDLTIGGKNVPKGRYVVQVLPTRNAWTLILQAETTGAASVNPVAYDATKDVARVELTTRALTAPVETLSMWLIPSTAPGVQKGELRISWDSVQLSTEWSAR